jgi:pimeloyl-ACP methyl ester carboxylesterase
MTKAHPEPTRSLGTAVLIHGCWGNPDDWMFVRRTLEFAGVRVETPDLPSHRSPQASMDDDVQLVREVIRASTPPVVCAGWSYGGGIMSLAVVGEPSVTHAVFVASLPFDPSDLEDASWIDADPHVVVHADGTYDIDSDWYVTDVEQHFSGEVREHLLSSPRRRVAMLTATDPPTVVGPLTIPMTVLFGTRDEGYSDNVRRATESNIADVRFVDTDHFIIFHEPEVVAQIVLEALNRGS